MAMLLTFTGLRLTTALAAAIALASAAWRDAAHAQAAFFQGKTITIGVGAASGGGLDTYARLIARHMGKHVPGNPSVVVSNMPGAGGQVVARHLYAVAPKDGTFMATFFPSVLVDPLLSTAPRVIDPAKFQYVGNAKAEVSVCIIRRDAPIKSLTDLLTTEVAIGATTPGSQVVDYPFVEARLLDVKFKLVTGYKGTRDIAAAIEKNEVQGICGIGWTSIKVQYPEITSATHFARVLVQEDLRGDPELNKAGIPLLTELAKSDTQREVLRLLYAQNELARPYVLPPDVPADRVDVLRKAFLAAAADPELQAEAAKMRIDVAGTSGTDMQKIVAAMYATSPPVVSRLSEILGKAK